jgi:hypothetical protein
MSAIISTVTAQQWGLLEQPELQSFQKMYDEDLLSEGIVFFPVALENYYSKLGMSKTEFSFMRNLLQLWAKNDKKAWFAQEQIEELFGKSRRQVQRDARKLAKEGFIIISEWDDLNNSGTHCIHYDCTPFLQMISQLVRVHRHRNTLMEDISAIKRVDALPTNNTVPVQDLTTATLTNKFFEKHSVPHTPSLSAVAADIAAEDVDASSVTIVSIKSNHIHMARGKKLSNASFIDMYDPAYAEPDESEPPTENNPRSPRHSALNQPETKELITEPRPAVQKASSERMTSTSQHKMSQAQLPPQNVQPESSYQNTSGRQTKTVQRTPIHATTQPDREQVRQKNQQQTRLPLLSSVIMREVSQAFRDYAPQNSQRDAAIIYRRLLLINRIQDDLTIKNPDQHFANLIKSVFQDLLAVSKQQHETNSNIDQIDNFMTELNHAAFYQFEQIKIMRHQRKNSESQYSRVSYTHASQPPKPIQLAEQETMQQPGIIANVNYA